ncbi:MAG: hypothetical protein WCY41_00055 [Candidatus Micrarchaeia archaeon]
MQGKRQFGAGQTGYSAGERFFPHSKRMGQAAKDFRLMFDSGCGLLTEGKFDDAGREFRKSLELCPDDRNAKAQLAALEFWEKSQKAANDAIAVIAENGCARMFGEKEFGALLEAIGKKYGNGPEALFGAGRAFAAMRNSAD